MQPGFKSGNVVLLQVAYQFFKYLHGSILGCHFIAKVLHANTKHQVRIPLEQFAYVQGFVRVSVTLYQLLIANLAIVFFGQWLNLKAPKFKPSLLLYRYAFNSIYPQVYKKGQGFGADS